MIEKEKPLRLSQSRNHGEYRFTHDHQENCWCNLSFLGPVQKQNKKNVLSVFFTDLEFLFLSSAPCLNVSIDVNTLLSCHNKRMKEDLKLQLIHLNLKFTARQLSKDGMLGNNLSLTSSVIRMTESWIRRKTISKFLTSECSA